MSVKGEKETAAHAAEEQLPPDSLTPELQRTDSSDVELVAPALPLPPVPSQPAEDILDIPATVHSEKLESLRETGGLMERARKFLENPSIRGEDPDKQRAFLSQKGLTQPAIDDLLARKSPLPPVPPRTYPGAAIPPTSLLELLLKVTRFFAQIAGVSAALLFAYFRLILPSLSYVLHARHELQTQRINHMEQLKATVSSVKSLRSSGSATGEPTPAEADSPEQPTDELLNTSASPEKSEPASTGNAVTIRQSHLQDSLRDLSNSIRGLREARTQNQDRPTTLHTVTNLTGYISSQIHFAPSSFGPLGKTNKPPSLGPVEDEVRREIRALKGLALNRRSFVSASPLPSSPRENSSAMT